MARCERIALDLEADPGVRCLGFDPTRCRDLSDEQLAGGSVKLVSDRRSAPFEARALSVCAVADDLGKPADTAAHEFGLRVPMAA